MMQWGDCCCWSKVLADYAVRCMLTMKCGVLADDAVRWLPMRQWGACLDAVKCLLIIIIMIEKRSPMQVRERDIDTLSVRRPQPHNTNRQKNRSEKTAEVQKGTISIGKWKSVGPALKTRQFRTIEYRVSKIVPHRLRGKYKCCGTATFCSAEEHQYTDVQPKHPACVWCTPHQSTATYGTGRAQWSLCIGLHLILYSIHNIETDRQFSMFHSNTPPVKKWGSVGSTCSAVC